MYFIYYKQDKTFVKKIHRKNYGNAIYGADWTYPEDIRDAKSFDSLKEATDYCSPMPGAWLSNMVCVYIHPLNFRKGKNVCS